jgi:hypothetical protein
VELVASRREKVLGRLQLRPVFSKRIERVCGPRADMDIIQLSVSHPNCMGEG